MEEFLYAVKSAKYFEFEPSMFAGAHDVSEDGVSDEVNRTEIILDL
jgi:hypothetical protein